MKLEPMFASVPHVPSICLAKDGPNAPAVPEVPAHLGQGKKRKPRLGDPLWICPTCKGSIKPESLLCCMSCHAVAPDISKKVNAHVLIPLLYDRRKGTPKVKPTPQRKDPTTLTAAEREELRADQIRQGCPPDVIDAFFAGIDREKEAATA